MTAANRFEIVVAADERRGIGKAGDLPWPRLAGDLAYFRHVTTDTGGRPGHNAVIMGRKTWASIPERFRPLPRRLNVVVSRTSPTLPDGVLGADSLDAALAAAATAGAPAVFVIGGGQLYAEAVADPRCALIHYTRVEGDFACDTFFPEFEASYQQVAVEPPVKDAGIRYAFERWARREPRT
ncbi:MAG: dihydrofolate reductase [Kofleriaceae bacterium]